MINLSTRIGIVRLEHPITLGAGICKTFEEFQTWLETSVSAIVVGSITNEPRRGNPGNALYLAPDGSYALNSVGLQNPGMDYYGKYLSEMARMAYKKRKRLIVSIAGSSPRDYMDLAWQVAIAGASMIELNLGCPNVWSEDGKTQGTIPSYDPGLVERILFGVEDAMSAHGNTPIIAKISPLPPNILKEVATVIARSKIRIVCAVNTEPNAFAWNGPTQAIGALDGLAGMSGPALKPKAMGVIKQLSALLPDDFTIIAAGGINSGQDVIDFQRISPRVRAVQVVTACLTQGPNACGRILTEFIALKSPPQAS